MNKSLLVGLSTLTVITGVIIGGLKIGQAASQYTDPNVAQTLQNHTERLNNQDARITNTENNVKDLQDKTSTPSSTKTVLIPEVVTQPAEVKADPQPAPITAVKSSYSINLTSTPSHYCSVVYSDQTKANLPDSGPDSCNDYLGQLKG